MSTPEMRVNDSELVEPPVVHADRRPSEWLMMLREAWRMRRTKIGVGIFAAIVLLAVAGPWVAPYSPTEFVAPPFTAAEPPTLWLGSDYIGHDVLTRVLYGGRTVILLAFAATVIGLSLGVTLGLITGYARRWIDESIMRILDVVLAFPQIVLDAAVRLDPRPAALADRAHGRHRARAAHRPRRPRRDARGRAA